MRFAVLVIGALLACGCQSVPEPKLVKTPADINAESLSRMPLAKREAMDAEGQRVFDMVSGTTRTAPLLGPGGLSLHMPEVAEGMHLINDYLRYHSVLGRADTEVAILVAARELDQAYEWSSHSVTAKNEGVDASVIDAINFGRAVDGLPEKQRTIIEFGRQIFRDHRLDSATWARAVELFTEQGALEMAAIMGDYSMAAVMLTATDQQIPPDRVDTLQRK